MKAMAVLALLLASGSVAVAATGPIVPAESADVMLDSFEEEAPVWRAAARDGAVHTLTLRAGIARHGARSLLLEMGPAPAGKGRHTVTLRWGFPKPRDWSAFGGISLWLQPHADPPPVIRPVIAEAGGALYWSRETSLAPRREGEWQLVEIPFRGFTWSWEGPGDANGKLDLDQVVALSFEIHAQKERAYSLGMDGVGLFHPRAAYAGPILRLRAPDNNKEFYVRRPGEEYRLVAEMRQLPAGRHAEVDVTGKDTTGQEVFRQTLSFEGKEGADRQRQEFTFPNPGPGYVGVTGVVMADGKPVYQAEQGVACLVPPDPRDAVRNEASIFGIWVNSDRRIGQQWDRILVRYKAATRLPDGRYQVEGCPPGVSAPSKWGWGDPELNRIVCFTDMPRWLSSQPDRADREKWSPTDWEQFADLVRFFVRGAKENGIRHFEVWNEPVPYASWMGPMESIVKLHETTYRAIKSVHPEARVLGPCPYTFLWEYLEAFFTAGGNRWVDDVVIHAYDSRPPDAHLASNLRRLRELMARHGLGDRDVYITEMGYSTPQVTEQEQARYLVRAFIYALSERVKVFLWHMLWDWSGTRDPENHTADPAFAIMRFERSPRPAYVAYAVMTRMLENARFVGPVEGLADTQRGFRFERRGRRITVLWEIGPGPSTLRLKEKAAQATRVEMMGTETPVLPARPGEYEVPLGPDVCYVVAE